MTGRLSMAKKRIDVSLVIINYNGFEVTRDLLRSIFKADKGELGLEIVVVDNASEDDSFKKLKQGFGKKAGVKLVRKPKNNFLAEAFNYGFKFSAGKIVVFMSNDLEVNKKWLVELVKGFDDDEVGIVGVALLVFQDKRKVDCLGCNLDWFLYGKRLETGKKFKKRAGVGVVDFVSGSVVGVRRELFIKAGKFDDMYGGNYEDVDLALRIRKLGYKVVVVYKSIVYHRGSWTVDRHVGNVNSSYLCRRNRLATMIKNYPRFKLILVIPVYLCLQLGLLVKELVIDRQVRLAMTGVRAVGWNVSHLMYY